MLKSAFTSVFFLYGLMPALVVDAGEPEMSRASAATFLKAALEKSREARDEAQQLAVLSASSIKVMAAFPENLLLHDAFSGLEPEASKSPSVLVRSWQRAVSESIRVLEFEITEEAPLPEGFPEPVPLGEVRIRRYPVYRMAQASMANGDDQAFGSLFAHITQNKIAMTAPVEIHYAPEEGGESAKSLSMAFLYRSPAEGQLGGEKVKVVDVKPLQVVSLGIDGPLSNERIREMASRLERWMKRHDLKAAGPIRAMCYNSPFVPVKKQFIEIQFPVAGDGEE